LLVEIVLKKLRYAATVVTNYFLTIVMGRRGRLVFTQIEGFKARKVL
jgi:hypothetical protein